MPEKSDNEALILIGAGIIIGAAFIFLAMRKHLFQVQASSLQPLQPQVTQSQPTPQSQPQPPASQAQAATQTASTYRQDTEFIKWYTETIIKPSIESAARESADKAIRQFMEMNPRTEMQTLGSKTAMPKAKTGNWMITRDSEGAIMSIETVKDTPQKEQSTKPTISLRLPEDRINISKEHIFHDA